MRKEEKQEAKEQHDVEGDVKLDDDAPMREARSDSKWEGHEESSDAQPINWGNKTSDLAASGGAPQGTGNRQDKSSTENPQSTHQKVESACENCGMHNHSIAECRRQFYDICGFSIRITYDCKKCLTWNYGPELCATQVEDQSFLWIDE